MKTPQIAIALIALILISGLIAPALATTDEDLSLTIDGTRSTAAISLTPSSSIDAYVIIQNSDPTTSMSITMTHGTLPGGLSIAFLDPSEATYNTFTLAPSTSTIVTVRLITTATITEESHTIQIYAEDSIRSLTTSETFFVSITASYDVVHFMVDIDGSGPIYSKSQDTPAGDFGAFHCYARNDGNVPIIVTLLLDTTSPATGWTATIQGTIDGGAIATLTIPVGTTRDYYILLHSPITAADGSSATVTSFLSIPTQPTANIVQPGLTVTTIVGGSLVPPRWELISASTTAITDLNTPAIFTTRIYNDNTVDMTTALSILPPVDLEGSPATGWDAEIYDDSGTIAGTHDAGDSLITDSIIPDAEVQINAASNSIFHILITPTAETTHEVTVFAHATFLSIARSVIPFSTTTSIPTPEPVPPIPYTEYTPYILTSLLIVGLAVGLYLWKKK